ncbi:Peroxisome biogenesis protein 2 [Platanthera guangdongensis]|uniref:RING-type E3 ubiquitin transferase (cysteine targeting) n=1 Tax=Platanthera guangdongensis TaxID=2320717 RepID=A0ABR2LZT6_9ASPA
MDKGTLASNSPSSSSSSYSSSASSSHTRSMDPPPENSWTDAYRISFPRWKSFSESTQLPAISISVSKVNQFDAARLDVEMSGMLKEQLVKVFSLMKPGFLFQYEAELDVFLEFLIWRFSIWVDKPTPGNALMNLRYRDERRAATAGQDVRTGLEGPGLSMRQKVWYCIANTGGQYIWARLQSFSAFRRWGDSEQRPLARRIWVLLQRAEGLYKAMAFSNLLLFLYSGRYRTLIERILKARLVYGSPNMNRAVSFEYMNRQLVWNEFSEMLLLLLPLLNSSSIKKFLLPFSKDKLSGSSGDESECPICHTNPTIPFVALPCQHRYCYYCLRTRCTSVSSYRCARCNEPVAAIQRHGAGENKAPRN